MRAEKQHRKELFLQELRAPARIGIYVAGLMCIGFISSTNAPMWPSAVIAGAIFATLGIVTAAKSVAGKQFKSPHYQMLWQNVRDRLRRFETAYGALKVAWDEELPVLRERVLITADSVYTALCRADVMQVELQKSEGHMAWAESTQFRPVTASQDKKVQELYQLADRNMAEYRQRLNAVTAGIQRCEAQTAVYITTLDSLRVRLLGYRLMGKSPEIEHQQFLETIGEAKSQLDAVDKALQEISFDRLVAQMELEGEPAPARTVAENVAMAAPPPMPSDVSIEERHI